MAEPRHFLRGPMYSAYSELREWKLRMKKAGLNPSTPIPVQVKKPVAEQTAEFRKENRKPSPLGRKREEKRSGIPRGGSVRGRADELLLMRSCASYQEMGSRNAEEVRGKKGIFGKTFTGFRRSTAKAAGWLG